MDRPLTMGGGQNAVRPAGSVKDILPATLLDWEGKVAAGLFLGGCNLGCSFCHNPDLADPKSALPSINMRDIRSFLSEKRDWLDGVVITGGEPTIAPDLVDIIDEIRGMGFSIKLDTNGTRPEILESLFSEGKIDSVAMDIKSTFSNYPTVTNSSIDPDKIKASINLIIRFNIDHEFRTTAYPSAVTPADLVEIASYLGVRLGNRYVIQQFKKGKTLKSEAATVDPYDIETIKEAAMLCNKYIPTKVR